MQASIETSRLAFITYALAAALGLSMAASPAWSAQPTLHERLGGTPAITAVVDDFVANVAADGRINRFFATTDIGRLKRLLVEQICAGAGGPCTYTGRNMHAVHEGMGVGEADFAALVDDLVRSLDKFRVPEPEKRELLTLLGSMKGDIVVAAAPKD